MEARISLGEIGSSFNVFIGKYTNDMVQLMTVINCSVVRQFEILIKLY